MQHRDAIRALVAEHHAVAPRLFGSVARGDEPGSDVDLLVDFTDEASLLDEIGLRLALADLVTGEPTALPAVKPTPVHGIKVVDGRVLLEVAG